MKDVIILDNTPEAFSLNPENGVPIKSWYEEPSDVELRNMVHVLKCLAKVSDVRTVIPNIVKNNLVCPESLKTQMRLHRGPSPFENWANSFEKFKKSVQNLFSSEERKETSSETEQKSSNKKKIVSALGRYQTSGNGLRGMKVIGVNLSDTTKLSATPDQSTEKLWPPNKSLFQYKPKSVKLIPKLQMTRKTV